MRLTVICWLWDGWRPIYTAKHVITLQRMVAANLTLPHRFICAVDRYRQDLGSVPQVVFEPSDITVKCGYPNCFRRVGLFKPGVSDLLNSDYALSLDLDCVIYRNIDSLITQDSFIAASGVNNRYCGSVFGLRLGAHPEVAELTQADADRMVEKRRGSDQAWFAETIPNGARYSPGQVRTYVPWDRLTNPPAILATPGPLKPWSPEISPAVRDEYARYR